MIILLLLLTSQRAYASLSNLAPTWAHDPFIQIAPVQVNHQILFPTIFPHLLVFEEAGFLINSVGLSISLSWDPSGKHYRLDECLMVNEGNVLCLTEEELGKRKVKLL